MKLGFDLDDVVLDTFSSFLDYHNQRYGTNFRLDNLTSYRIWEVGIGKNREEAIGFMDEFFNEVSDIPFIEDAEERIKILISEHEVYFISSRLKNNRENAYRIIKRNFPESLERLSFTNDFSGGDGKSKAEVCEQRSICCYVEDHYGYLLPFQERGIKSLLFRRPWNEVEWQRLRNSNENGLIIPVENWNEILQEIRRLENEN